MSSYYKLINLGLCVSCAVEKTEGTVQCSKCANKKKDQTRKSIQKAKDHGLCTYCRKSNDNLPRKYCLACKIKQTNNQRYRRLGLCRSCGSPPVEGKRHCHQCISKPKVCLDCGMPRIPNETRCADCHNSYRLAHVAKVCRANKKAKDAGLCLHCRKPCDNLPQVSCISCSRKKTEARRQLRRDVFIAYGGAFCACCGESIFEFLTIDHINNDGSQHRKKLFKENGKIMAGVDFCRLLKKQGFPPGYQVLCWNCNVTKGLYGQCPHKKLNDGGDEIT